MKWIDWVIVAIVLAILGCAILGIVGCATGRDTAGIQVKPSLFSGIDINSQGALAVLIYGMVKDTIFAAAIMFCVWWLYPRKRGY